MERLASFGLPQTFPSFMVPETAAEFVRASSKGMTKDELIALASSRGFDPLWKPLPHVGERVYGLGLTVEGTVIPLMVKMIDDEH